MLKAAHCEIPEQVEQWYDGLSHSHCDKKQENQGESVTRRCLILALQSPKTHLNLRGTPATAKLGGDGG
jgi:hypothetical protein